MMKKIKKFIRLYEIELVVFIIASVFSTWLMFSTFSYKNGNMLIASKAWSDFASHIPLIRSFSLGYNFPPQYPLFPGAPIKYHFLFFAFAGLLEKMGVRIDYALNIPSVIGFALLILMVYVFSAKVFKSRVVGFLSVIFFLFNGSLEFIKFFSLHPLSSNTIYDIVSNNKFISFGPYDGSTISAFWNLNIYTNQRHLAISYALSLILILLNLKPYLENKKQNIKISVLSGIVFGLLFFLNIAVFLITGIVMSALFILLKKQRLNIFVLLFFSGLIALPQYIYMEFGSPSTSQIAIYPGYLIGNNLTFLNFMNYWFQNLGFHLILIPLGFLVAPKKAKTIFISFFTLFIVGNLFRFSPEVAANHKFFNLFMITGVMFSAYFLVYLWKKYNFLKPPVILMFFLLIFSGILDFFPVYNDVKISLPDYPKNKDILWIIKNTNPDSVFLNTNYLYDDASLAGRKIFLGWPYFAWSQGYDTLSRDTLRKSLLSTNNRNYFCKNSSLYNINYVELNLNSQDANDNKTFFDRNFPLVYKNLQNQLFIYNIKGKCL